jgi:hypothetical protein
MAAGVWAFTASVKIKNRAADFTAAIVQKKGLVVRLE